MTTNRDTTRILRAWLEEGVTDLPDRVLDTVLDQLPAVRQRRRSLPGWLADRNASTRLAIGVLAVAIAFALGIGLVGRNIGEHTQPTPVPLSPTPFPALLNQPVLTAGRYQVPAMYPLSVSLVVPDGWSALDGWAVMGPGGAGAPDGIGLGFWRVAILYVDPLDVRAGVLDPPVGPAVEDLVAALSAHPGWTVEETVDVTIGDFTGSRVTLIVPDDVEFDDCGINSFLIWREPSGGERCAQGPGQIEHIYIVDVDGDRIVYDAVFFPDTPTADLAALQRVVESIEIDVAPGQD